MKRFIAGFGIGFAVMLLTVSLLGMIADSGNFALSTAWTGTVDETLTLYIQADNDYIELTRSAN